MSDAETCQCKSCILDRSLRQKYLASGSGEDQGAYFTAMSLLVPCPRCKAEKEVPCLMQRRRGSGTRHYHLPRGDLAVRYLRKLKWAEDSGHWNN
jgi:hypothetical protein